MKRIRTLTIQRKFWLTPKKADAMGTTMTMVSNGMMDFFGFAFLKLGVQLQDMFGRDWPGEVSLDFPQFTDTSKPVDGLTPETQLAEDLQQIGDDEDISDEEREKQLIQRCNEAGIKLEFVD